MWQELRARELCVNHVTDKWLTQLYGVRRWSQEREE